MCLRCIKGEPLLPDRVFEFLVDEPEPHPAYDFFSPEPLPVYAGNLNNNSGWIEADVPLLEELGVIADEPMVSLIVEEIAKPIVDAGEQMFTLVVDIDEDIAMLFCDDDFEDDDSEGFDEEEVWKVNEEWLMALVTPPSMPAVPPSSVYEVGGPSTAAAEGQSFPFRAPRLHVPPSVIEDLSTRSGNLEYGHGQFLKKVIQVSDAKVAAGEAGSADCDPERRGDFRTNSTGAGFAGSSAVERYTDSIAADYNFRDEQPGEHTDVVYFGDG
ncbi:hypothetical protein Tco_1289277 [Tanacetum coccineum]